MIVSIAFQKLVSPHSGMPQFNRVGSFVSPACILNPVINLIIVNFSIGSTLIFFYREHFFSEESEVFSISTIKNWG